MFYCDECRQDYEWPESIGRSIGDCETCGKRAICHNVSSYRPSQPKRPGEYDEQEDE